VASVWMNMGLSFSSAGSRPAGPCEGLATL
jgi:hypothetical protein